MRYVNAGTLSQSNQRPLKPIAKKPAKHRWLKMTFGVIVLGIAAFALYSYLPPIKDALANAISNTMSGSSAALSLLTGQDKPLQQSKGQTNILLLGLDKRADENYQTTSKDGTITSHGCFRADTMIIASYNYDTKKVTMLSLPRDLYVTVPSFGSFKTQSMKINGAYCQGDLYDYPGGGAALTKTVVSQYLGIPIHYTARIDFAGFAQAVDAVGGVDITVERAFVDYQYPIEGREDALPVSSRYKIVRFEAGLQHMDGQTALEYARSRHAAGTEGTDFARSQRQEKVIAAFKDKIFSADTLMNLSALNDLYKSLGETFSTTVQVDELPAAYKLAQNVDTSVIKTYNLDDRSDVGGLLYNPPAEQYAGAYVLIPRAKGGSWTEIKEFVTQIFSAEGYSESSTSATPIATE